ncbi:unnamed protein product (macronuclear) [Paramecium tetraurelia]|uniref:Uncharacterized protein n=1 Tax=Paramecium tetraurelia TaxID=5888 RepID=A0E206_PARTE|nr:uncharacterized protein GSPATT00022494001 [Paramecium tetraurelia]CAK89323.1 unnamed protein product [Paramecium tetraurelia]|eukprot:XP_001456720.1 hypothetical protein (macronuclear) [Paramecium tetraurelia strain d4-2]
MQFLQPQYVVPQQPQYCQQPIVLKTEELRPVQQLHHQSREREKENLNPKAFQSGRLLSQHDTPQHSQRSLQQIPVGAFSSQTSTEAQVKQLREEMLKMFEFSRKDFELVKTELEQSKQELVEQKKMNKTFVAQIEGLNQQLVQEQEKTKQLKHEIEELQKTQGQQISELARYSEIKQEIIVEIKEYFDTQLKLQSTQQQPQPQQQITLDTYDTYIKKYEQFNKQVNDYLLNRKLPDNQYNDTIEQDNSNLMKDKESPVRFLNQEDQQIILTKEDMDRYKMSIIHENENEEDEIIYQVDENGYVMNQDGNHLVDNYGRLIQLSEKDIEYFKSKNQLDEIK